MVCCVKRTQTCKEHRHTHTHKQYGDANIFHCCIICFNRRGDYSIWFTFKKVICLTRELSYAHILKTIGDLQSNEQSNFCELYVGSNDHHRHGLDYSHCIVWIILANLYHSVNGILTKPTWKLWYIARFYTDLITLSRRSISTLILLISVNKAVPAYSCCLYQCRIWPMYIRAIVYTTTLESWYHTNDQ